MDQTDFALVMVSGILITMVIFLLILFKIFGKNMKDRQIVTILPEITKIEPHESQPEKIAIIPQEIAGIEKELRQEHVFQKRGQLEEAIEPLNENLQIPIKTKEKSLSQSIIHSCEKNDKLKLEDIIIEIRNEKIKKTARTKKKPEKKVKQKKKAQVLVDENPESNLS